MRRQAGAHRRQSVSPQEHSHCSQLSRESQSSAFDALLRWPVASAFFGCFAKINRVGETKEAAVQSVNHQNEVFGRNERTHSAALGGNLGRMKEEEGSEPFWITALF